MSPAPTLPEPLDLQHHLAQAVKEQRPSAMKAMGKLLKEKLGVRSLAGGMPHHSLFPLKHATFTMPTIESISSGSLESWKDGTADTEDFHLKKTGPGTEDDPAGVFDLNDVLQYGLSNGFPELIELLEELNECIHGRVLKDAGLFVTCGGTDGISKVFQLFVEPGIDTVLTEEYSFDTSLINGRSRGAKFFPVMTDDDGSVMPAERYDKIYEICSKHDVIIMEDDPYFALQYTPYEADATKREAILAEVREEMAKIPLGEEHSHQVAKVFNDYAGIKSYLSRDIEGRVVRIDTFSKIFGPGIRTGWIQCNALFAERLMRLGEASTQSPNNVGQAILTSYLSPEHWGISGFMRWMWAVRLEYQMRRDYFIDCMAKYCDPDLVSTKPCGGGMFQFLDINIKSHPRYSRTQIVSVNEIQSQTAGKLATRKPFVGTVNGDYTTNTSELMDELWQYLIDEAEVLLMPARLFLVERPGVDQTDRLNFFRATFAGDMPNIDAALKSFGEGLKRWFERG
ncbi:Aromatic/aminoadipate aminotransferase 1 [Saitozyma podzolica]|uniref:Aromatic/aminoadipate aminotransferase 1 n=1 Tax=Saitozyma podzolica TaxID=1890683 RepID=A0A427Y8I2_9TREE|nr:Aromatic/aminoadipate aminotransferase 1 [Saitozyma podzolica]